MFFKKVACFTDIHFGMKGNSRIHNDDCEAFIYWFIDQAKANEQGIVFNDLFMDEEKTYHWIEIFENKKSHETHFKQEATQDFFEFMGPLFDGKPDFKTFESV